MKLLKVKSIKRKKHLSRNVYDIHHRLESKNFYDNRPNLIVNNMVISNCSRHAGGVVIAEELDKHMPLINSGGVTQTPWTEGQTVRHLEPMGFIKFDVLGLASLRMMESAIRHILRRHKNIESPTFEDVKKYYNENLHPDVIDFNDQKVYEHIFHQGRWAGVFQFTETGAQNFCVRAEPKNLIDLAVITSIQRPGPLSANVDKLYLKVKEDPDNIEYLNDTEKEITESTYGFLVFQEQIALLAYELGEGISIDEANLLRKVLTKKGTDKESIKNEIHTKFLSGCELKGISRIKAQRLWERFEFFSKYGFNKSLHFSEKITIYNKIGSKKGVKMIKDVKPGDYVRSRDEKSKNDIFVEVKKNHNHGKLKIFEIELEGGIKVKCTMNHKFRVKDGRMLPLWKILKEKLDIVVNVEK